MKTIIFAILRQFLVECYDFVSLIKHESFSDWIAGRVCLQLSCCSCGAAEDSRKEIRVNELQRAVKDRLDHVSFETKKGTTAFSDEITVSLLPDSEDEKGRCNLHISILPMREEAEALEGMTFVFQHESGQEFPVQLNREGIGHVHNVPVGKYTIIFPDS